MSTLVTGPDWIIPTKLAPPHQLVDLVDRAGLVGRLEEGRSARLQLVVGAAGSGKTTLLGQWQRQLARAGIPCGWLSLDEDDGDPTHLISYIVLSLARAGVPLGQLARLAQQGLVDMPCKAALSALVNQIAGHGGPVVLILDDFHRAESREVGALLGGLLPFLPANLSLVISGRDRPKLPLAGLKAMGQVRELTAGDLRFSAQEARHVLHDLLPDADISALTKRTEGWAVAIQLARIWLEAGSGRARLLDRFCGSTRDVADYLAEQVLADLPEDLRQFLMQTSILERVNADLAEAVTGRGGARARLARLSRLDSLLVPLDGESSGGWLRYHHLLQDYLRDVLARDHAALLPDLHARASRWFEARGFLTEAVRHARLGGDLASAARLVESAGGWSLILSGGIGLLRNLLQNFPAESFLRHPRLGISRVYLHIKDGELAQARRLLHRIPGADRPLELIQEQPAFARDALIIGSLLAGYEDAAPTADGLVALRRVIDGMPEDDQIGSGALRTVEAVQLLHLGDLAGVERAGRRALRHMSAANSVLGLAYCLFHLGQSALYRGLRREAEATYREAMAIAADNFGADSGLKAVAAVLLAEVLHEAGRGDEARALIGPALAQIETADGWLDIYASGYRVAAALQLAQGEHDGALAVLARGERTAAERGLARLGRLIACERARVLTAMGETAWARDALAPLLAELPLMRASPAAWREHHAFLTVQARLLLAEGHPCAALEAAGEAAERAREAGMTVHRIQALILRAEAAARLALESGGSPAADPVGDLAQALTLAAPEGLRQVFLERGERLAPLLRDCLRRSREIGLDSLARAFAEELERTLARPRDEADTLSPRERAVVIELCRGASNKEIARALAMTENTVKFHLKNIFGKLGVDRRAAAIITARRLLGLT
ncbi:LuxR C-terminal-related transcriptional regulator [Rhodocista pekingensis]|uniref:LuxR C-terminal-related transcriptional regulator n=1 Tax=Rhodocista pekingensis TaxID=201185 RepID=A0ABW2KYB1_9PROT